MTKNLLPFAKILRANQTEAEHILWQHLRAHRFKNIKFRRQKIIDFYVVDFVALKYKLVIEVDGSQHALNQNYDLRRDKYLNAHGYRVLRFWNNFIFEELDTVLDVIFFALKEKGAVFE